MTIPPSRTPALVPSLLPLALALAVSVLKTSVFCLALSCTAFAEAPAAAKPDPTPATIDAAICRGVHFLVSDQNTNGSWGGPTRTKGLNVYAPLPGAHHAFRAGATGLALAGLIDSAASRAEATTAIEKAASWVAAELPNLRRADQTTTYNAWGHAYGLRAITRLYQRETDPAKKSDWKRLAQEQIDLANRYEDINGGWGYLDIFDGLATQKPSGLPTSFTTATVLLAMAEARQTMAVKLDENKVRQSITSINFQRTPDFPTPIPSPTGCTRAMISTARPVRSRARKPATPASASSATIPSLMTSSPLGPIDFSIAKASSATSANAPFPMRGPSASQAIFITTASTISLYPPISCPRSNTPPTPSASPPSSSNARKKTAHGGTIRSTITTNPMAPATL